MSKGRTCDHLGTNMEAHFPMEPLKLFVIQEDAFAFEQYSRRR